MLKLSLVPASIALTAAVLGLVLPAAHAVAAKPGPETVAASLLRDMNSRGSGAITRRVDCVPGPTAGGTFACTLVSARSTSLDVRVRVVDGSLRTTWLPPRG